LRCPVWPSHSKSVFFRGLHFLSFTLSSMLLLLFRVSRADVFLIHHPPPLLALTAWLFRRNGKCPYVFRMADLWPEFITGAGVSENRLLIKMVEYFMKFIYRTTSHIVVPSPGFKRRLVDKGVPENKITVVHNYADEATYHPLDADQELKQLLSINDKDVIIIYAGNIGNPQRIDILIDSMKIIEHRHEIKLLIIGDGSCASSLKNKYLNEGIKSVTFFQQMLPDEVNRYYSIADALFIQLENQLIWNDTIPSKIYAYMLAGRPIIAALKGDGADVVSVSRGGYVCEPCNVHEIADCILKIADMSHEDRVLMGKENYNYVIKNFSKNIMIKSIENILINAMKKNNNKIIKNVHKR
jgi:colanic acid biosynthesis glycosyl transferase WcaI